MIWSHERDAEGVVTSGGEVGGGASAPTSPGARVEPFAASPIYSATPGARRSPSDAGD